MRQIKKHSILKSTIIVSIIIIVGKFIGFAREAIIAAFYGADSATDAFFFAQAMPSMLFPAVCSSLSTAFISLYVTKIVKYGEKEGDKFASRAFVASLAIASVLSGIALIFAPYIVPIFAPGFEKETLTLAIHLTRLTMGSFTLIMAHYMLAAMLNSKKIFYGSQVAGLLCNVFIIIVTICLGKGQNIDILTLTVIGGHIVQVFVLLGCIKKRVSLTIFINPFHADMKMMFVLALPILLGNSVVQLNNIVDKALASMVAEGAVSALSYSNSLNSMVSSIFITSLSTVLYPTLTENFSEGNMDSYKKNLVQSLTLMTMVLIPITIITIFFSKDIVSFVYKRGSFDFTAAELTSVALAFYAIKYVFTAIREVLIRGFYALKDTKTPMINGSIAVVANIICSIILVRFMGIGGIALGTSISSIISALLLLFSVQKRIPEFNLKGLMPSMKKLLLAGILTAITLYFFAMWLPITSPLLRFMSATILGFGVYGGMLMLLKCNELMVAVTLVRKKLNLFRIY